MTRSKRSGSNGEARRGLLTTRRFLSLWLPRLATDRARRLEAIDRAAPLAAVARVNNADRLVCVDANAARLGLTIGLSLADARARHPALVAVEANPAEEARLLERLCDWCSRFTPLAALDRADGLMLDISGVAHLFGGEQALMEECLVRLAALGITAAAGVASNPRAAWALARFSSQKIAPEDLERQGLRQTLPRPAARRPWPRRENRRRHGAGGPEADRRHRAPPPRADHGAVRRAADGAARRAERPRARLDRASLSLRPISAPSGASPRPCRRSRRSRPTLRKLADDLVVLLERQAKGARRIELALYRVDGACAA